MDHLPNPPCPSLRLECGLNVTTHILSRPLELLEYANRVPLLNAWSPESLSNPIVKQNLLYSLRSEALPHLALLFKEAFVREPYLKDNGRLFTWIVQMAQGAVPPRNDPTRGKSTDRCPACSSSFFGLPLKDHTRQECGFLQLIEARFILQFLIANTFAFCGFCNSRSVHHTFCLPGMEKACTDCGILGHQAFHQVCRTPLGESAEAFQRGVKKIRIQRLHRIRFLAHKGLLGFPLPTDSIPKDLLMRVQQELAVGKRIKGSGPLYGQDAEPFPMIPDHVYRWKRYSGLRNVELEVDDLLKPLQMKQQESDWFMILEKRARETYRLCYDRADPPFILSCSFNIPHPVFPRDIVAPGGEYEVRHNVPVPQLEAPGPAAVPSPAPLDEQVKAQSSTSAESRESLTSVVTPQMRQLQARVEANPIPINEDVLRLLTPVHPKPRFEDAVKELKDSHDLRPDGSKPLISGNGGVRVMDISKHFERELFALVHDEVEQCRVRVYSQFVTFGLPTNVIDALLTIEAPVQANALVERIHTWTLLFTGDTDPELTYLRTDKALIERYYTFLFDLASALRGHPRCFIQFAKDVFGFSISNVLKKIPSIRDFISLRQKINQWKVASAEGFALSGVPRNKFPLNDTCVRNDPSADQQREQEVETTLEGTLKIVDNKVRIYTNRFRFPPLLAIDTIQSVNLPAGKQPLVSRIHTVQRFLAGVPEHPSIIEQQSESVLYNYLTLCHCILTAMRVMVSKKKTAPIRLSDCLLELVHGSSTSFEIIIPSMIAYAQEPHSFWLAWVDQLMMPLMQRIVKSECKCNAHRWIEPASTESSNASIASDN